MNLTDTIQLTEALWTAAALPGVWLWAQNLRNARASRVAVRVLGLRNGRAVFAAYAVKSTAMWLAIEVLFVGLGVLAMVTPANPGATNPRTLVVTGGLILASVGISYLALQWHRVDAALLRMARERAKRVQP